MSEAKGLVIAALITAAVAIVGLLGNAYFNRQSEEQRTQEAELQAYLDDVGALLIAGGDTNEDVAISVGNEDGAISAGRYSDNENALVRAKTVGLVEGLDEARRTTVVAFLYDTSLIYLRREDQAVEKSDDETGAGDTCSRVVADDAESPVVLWRARLDGIALGNSRLQAINLSQTYLNEANFEFSDLFGANLYLTQLDQSRLNRSDLSCTNMSEALLTQADLSESYLNDSNLSQADLRGAVLSGADLSGANLEDANLQGVDLQETEGLTQSQIDQTCGDEGTKLPNGLQAASKWSTSDCEQPNENG